MTLRDTPNASRQVGGALGIALLTGAVGYHVGFGFALVVRGEAAPE